MEQLNIISEPAQTPLMQQYYSLKAKYPDAILLYRVGDFYETFGEDAIKTAAALGIILSNRNNGGSQIELAGFPYHSLDVYLPKLVRAGYRVALCEQLEKPSPQKKIVKRGITEVVTPGIKIDDNLLENNSNNFLSAVYWTNQQVGISFLDISTGEFMVAEGDWNYIDKLLQSFSPSEVLVPKNLKKVWQDKYQDAYYLYCLDEWIFTEEFALPKLIKHFEVNSLKGFGIDMLKLAPITAGALLQYLSSTENDNLQHILSISRLQEEQFVWMDRFTIRNLELIHPLHENGKSLLDIIDFTSTSMGSRMLKKWIVFPLTNKNSIDDRLNTVKFLFENIDLAEFLIKTVKEIGDLERLISKVPLGKINPREVSHIKKSLQASQEIQKNLLKSNQPFLKLVGDRLNPCLVLQERISKMLQESPPTLLNKGNVIADGCNEELDELRYLIKNSKEILLNIQQKEAERTGIDNLKIGFNNVFGYYLEVTNKHKDKFEIPADWVRKQTLSNGERYITEELKNLETRILSAEDKMTIIEEKLYKELIEYVAQYIEPIQQNAHLIAQLDCLLSFSIAAKKNKYFPPIINEGHEINITSGRHPVIEHQLPLGEQYITNNVLLDTESQQIMMITGPNMAGKSALLRQTALICLMAQIGSFVPAESAEIGLLDKVFTRVGASDNISSGESTFMVEMNETASILNNISNRSLILLDEIGRGTSTYDGISIAWSIAEFLHDNHFARPKTLFATHYHELNELEGQLERVKNFHITTKEVGNKVIFLRKLVLGGSEHSFGIHVAKMAGMPKIIVERANELLKELENSNNSSENSSKEKMKGKLRNVTKSIPLQLNIFESTDPRHHKIIEIIKELELDGMTPIDCLMKLHEIKKIIS